VIAVTDNEVIIWLCLLTQVTDRRSRYAYRQGLFVIKTAGNMVKEDLFNEMDIYLIP
jgi:hypothetical protein